MGIKAHPPSSVLNEGAEGADKEMVEYIIYPLLIQWVATVCIVRFYRFPGRRFSDVIPYLRPDHETELLDLLDPIKEANLAEALGYKRFRKEQLRRMHLAQECLAQRRHNARIFQEWSYNEASSAARMFNLEMSEDANTLTDVCLNYRVSTWATRLELYIWYLAIALLPFTWVPRISSFRKRPSFDLMESYAAVEQAAEKLALECGRNYSRRLTTASCVYEATISGHSLERVRRWDVRSIGTQS